MNNVRKLCRVCMATEWNENLVPIFQGNNQTATDIFLITGVEVLDLPNCPALICIKCIEDLSRAIIFRNRCKSADQFLKNSLNYFEKSSWNSDLNQVHESIPLNDYGVKNEQDMLKSIKSEPLEVESFFEYPTISAEAILNENSEENDWVNENHHDDYEIHNKKVKRREKKHSEQQFTCEVCGKSFELKSKYNRHYRSKHLLEREKIDIISACHYCMKQFDSKTQLKDHIRYKHEVHDFYCDHCGKDFSVKNKLMKHFREFHIAVKTRKQRVKREPKESQCFPCSVCGKICASTTFLRVHEKSHVKIRPEDYYYCDLCGNKFRTKNPLALHITTRHVLKLRFTCDKCPGKSWARKDHMKRHVKVVHENIRDFKCEWCGKGFPEKRKLECHIRIHTGEQPFACHFCGKKYTHETDYRRHIWSHTGERKYKCTSCRIAFNKRSELIAHRSECVYYNYNHNNINI